MPKLGRPFRSLSRRGPRYFGSKGRPFRQTYEVETLSTEDWAETILTASLDKAIKKAGISLLKRGADSEDIVEILCEAVNISILS